MSEGAYRDVLNLAADHPTLMKSVIRVDAQGLRGIAEDWPGIPEGYLSYLETVGWGELGVGHFMLYSAPVSPAEWYEDRAVELAGIALIGDDFAGYHAGIRLSDNAVVEISHHSSDISVLARDFPSFIRQTLTELVEYLRE